MVTVVDKEPTFTSDTSFDAIDALEELEIDDLDAIPEFIREDESNAHHLPAQPKQPGPKAAAPVQATSPAPVQATPAPAPVQAAPTQTSTYASQITTGSMPAIAPQATLAPGAAPVPMAPVAPVQPAPAPLYAATAPVSSQLSSGANPFTAPPASVPMESFQTIAAVTTSTLPAYSQASTLPPQAPRHHHSLGSPLLDRHPGTINDAPNSDELETLFSGVHQQQNHDLGGLLQSAKKTPSFYLMIGFMAGAVVSLLSVWGYSSVSTHFAKANDNSGKEIVTKVQEAQKEQHIVVQSVDPNAEIVPISSTYEVKSGDTLVVIAMKNYKKVTPRLIDQIVKANGLKSANALSLGQTLKLPNYTNQSSKLAHRMSAAAARAKQVQ